MTKKHKHKFSLHKIDITIYIYINVCVLFVCKSVQNIIYILYILDKQQESGIIVNEFVPILQMVAINFLQSHILLT